MSLEMPWRDNWGRNLGFRLGISGVLTEMEHSWYHSPISSRISRFVVSLEQHTLVSRGSEEPRRRPYPLVSLIKGLWNACHAPTALMLCPHGVQWYKKLRP